MDASDWWHLDSEVNPNITETGQLDICASWWRSDRTSYTTYKVFLGKKKKNPHLIPMKLLDFAVDL